MAKDEKPGHVSGMMDTAMRLITGVQTTTPGQVAGVKNGEPRGWGQARKPSKKKKPAKGSSDFE